MRIRRLVAMVLFLVAAFACGQKSKKHTDVSAAFMNARHVYVEAFAGGDITQPGLYPPDRQAILDVDDGIQNWNRYTLNIHREQSDLVFVVRKGRSAEIEGRGGVSPGQRPPGPAAQGRQPGQAQGDEDSLAGGAQIGPSDDMLQVFLLNSDGKLIGPIWNREMKDGLEGPGVPLLQQLRDAVERAYPSQPPAKKP
jgi:hypothetical protein